MDLVYVLREGQSNVFKIGRTSGGVEDRLKGLRTGNSQVLSVFGTIETDNASVCEKRFHKLLATKKVERPGGGKEFFEMASEQDMRQAIERFEDMEVQRRAVREAVKDFEKIQCTNQLREPIAEDMELLSQLRRIKTRLDEISVEAEDLNFEREVIESQLKNRIGTSLGIRGVATWQSNPRRLFSEELLRQRDPDLYQNLFDRFCCLDTAAWRKAQLAHYKQIQTTYFVSSISRRFEIVSIDQS